MAFNDDKCFVFLINFQTFIMEHNNVQKIPFGAFSKAKYLVRVKMSLLIIL